jgi:hypothetical protein
MHLAGEGDGFDPRDASRQLGQHLQRQGQEAIRVLLGASRQAGRQGAIIGPLSQALDLAPR